jgi:hypothetical protein
LKTGEGDRKSAARAAYVDTLRERSGIVFAQCFIIVQEIEWITWYGDNDPYAIDKRRVGSYEERVNDAYGTLLGAMAATASIDLKIYDEMKPILNNLYDLESRVGSALRGVMKRGMLKRYASSAIKDLRYCRITAARIRESLPSDLNRIMRLSELQDSSEVSTWSAPISSRAAAETRRLSQGQLATD